MTRKWIKKLKLQNFQKIEVRFGSSQEMGDSVGWAQWSPEYGHALIIVLDPLENEELTADEYDEFLESTIIHELLHLRLEGHKTMESVTDVYDPAHEAAINILSDILAKG